MASLLVLAKVPAQRVWESERLDLRPPWNGAKETIQSAQVLVPNLLPVHKLAINERLQTIIVHQRGPLVVDADEFVEEAIDRLCTDDTSHFIEIVDATKRRRRENRRACGERKRERTR